jgi:hypothetical protein
MAVEMPEEKKKTKKTPTEPPPATPRDRPEPAPSSRSALERFFPNGTPFQRQLAAHHDRRFAEADAKLAASAAKTEPPAADAEG